MKEKRNKKYNNGVLEGIYLTFYPNRIGIEKAGMQNDFFYTINVIQKLTDVRLPIDGLSHQGIASLTREMI